MSEIIKAPTVEEQDCLRAEAESYRAAARLDNLRADIEALALEAQLRKDNFDSAQDYRNGYLLFVTDVNDSSCWELIVSLRRMIRMRPGRDIIVDVSTPGGSIYDGFSAYDEIQRIQKDAGITITMRVRGMAASMGAVLLQSANHRVCGPNARLMLHRAAFGAQGNTADVEDTVEQVKDMEDSIYRVLGDRTKHPANYWKKRLGARKDVWIGAEEALRLGLIDEIG